jgi:signal transduction histidine kinase
MLSWVAHEIKTPLSAALTLAELTMRGFESGETPDTTAKRLVKMRRQLLRMDELVNAALDAAQLQEGGMEVELVPTDFRELVERAVHYFGDLYPEVAFELADGPSVEIEADAQRLRQILDNLLSNAVKYGAKNGNVEIWLAATDRSASVSVKDYGRGIPQSELPHIFDRFHRVAGSGGRGHGLGLYIAAALSRLHGGEIGVESTPGGGSTFTLTVPLHRREPV